jgi:hypothetical protein
MHLCAIFQTWTDAVPPVHRDAYESTKAQGSESKPLLYQAVSDQLAHRLS